VHRGHFGVSFSCSLKLRRDQELIVDFVYQAAGWHYFVVYSFVVKIIHGTKMHL